MSAPQNATATNRVVLEGIGRLGWTYGKPCSLVASLEAVLTFLGHRDADYTWLMGISGAAFHMRWHPAWRTLAGSIDDPLYCDHACAAVGRPYWYSFEQPLDLWAEVTRSLDAGRPALVEGLVGRSEYGFIAGYDEGQRQVFGRAAVRDEHDYITADKPLERMENLIFLGAAGPVPDRAAVEVASIGTALSVLRGASLHWVGGQVRGVAAWAAWAAALRDAATVEGRVRSGTVGDLVAANDYLYTAVSSARREAAAYLRRVAPRLPAPGQGDAAGRAATAFAEVATVLEGRGALGGNAADGEALIADTTLRHEWAALVEKAGKYDQAGLLALEGAWRVPPAEAAQQRGEGSSSGP